MDLVFVLRSVIIGITLAAAVRPIWMLVMQRTLARSWVVGMASGLGVAIADGLFGLAGGLGLTAIAASLSNYDIWMRLAGGLLLVYLGLRIALTANIRANNHAKKDGCLQVGGLLGAFGSIFLLTIANPLTIFSFAAVCTGMGARALELGSNSAWIFAVSIFAGSALWWLALVSAVSLLRSRINLVVLKWINRVAGAG